MCILQSAARDFARLALPGLSLWFASASLSAQDAFIRFDQPSYVTSETGAVVTVSVTREWNLASTVSIDYVTEPGSAIPGVDYVPSNGRLTFLPGQGSNGFTVLILDDRSVDEVETLQLRLSNPSPGAVLLYWSSATIEIRDDEIPSVLDGAWAAGVGPGNDVLALALQEDGRVLIGGQFNSVHGASRERLARLLPNGAVDPVFRPALDGDVYGIALRSDGGILVGGAFTTVNGSAAVGVTRLLPDGAPDTSFSTAVNGELRTLAVQPDGKVVIGGRFTEVDGQARRRIARLNGNGSLDASFGAGAGANDHVRCLALQPDGKIVLGGQFTSVHGVDLNRVARLNPDGSLDTGFKIGTGASGDVRAVALQADGRILLGGEFTNFSGVARSYLVRLQPDGTVDSGFAVSLSGLVRSVVVTPDQKILIGGQFYYVNEVSRSFVARLHPDGRLDPTFGGATFVVNDDVFALAVQSDGHILAAGQFYGAPNRIARFFGDVRTNSFALPAPTSGNAAFYVKEEAPGLSLSVTRRGDSAAPASVWYRTESLTALAGLDFAGQTNVVHFAPGEVRKPIEVPLLNDAVLEGSEQFRVALLPEPAGVALGYPKDADVVIQDNEGPFGFSVVALDVDDLEADTARVLVQRGGEFGTATVELATVDTGSATPNVDYTPVSVTLVFAPGENVKEVDIAILPDALAEGIEEFRVVLRNATGSTGLAGNPQAVVRIHDADSVIDILGFAFATEATESILVTLSRSGTAQKTATVQFRTENGTATSGLDFVATNGVVTFGPGERYKVVLIGLINDGLVEGEAPEKFPLVLFNPTGHARVGAAAVCEIPITDNDLGIAWAEPEFLVSERGQGVLRLRRNDDGTAPLSVSYVLTPITAVPGVDYSPQPGTVTLAPGETNGALRLTLFDNSRNEPDRTLRVTLVNPGPGASLGSLVTTIVRIIDDDQPGSVIPLRNESWPSFQLFWEVPGEGSLKVQPDGRTLVAFSTYLRLNADGSPDPGFTTLDFDGRLGALVLGLQPDGKILIGGSTSNNVEGGSCLYRVNPSGTRDATFDTSSFGDGSVRAIVPLADGRILVGGDFPVTRPYPGFTNGEALLRLQSNGRFDPTWHPASIYGGVGFYYFRSVIRAIAVQADGRILAGGSIVQVDGVPRANLVRFSANGVLEAAFFSPAGLNILDGPVDALAVQTDGKILIGGVFHSVRGTARPGLARLLPDGALDLAFNPELPAGSQVRALQLQPDGRLFVGGGTLYPDSGPSPTFVLRLESTGVLDSTFSATVNGPVSDLQLLPGGDLMIAGGFTQVNELFQPELARLDGGFRARFVVPDGVAPLFPLQVIGWPQARYVLEASANLSVWHALATNASPTGLVEFGAPSAPAPSVQFYRARLVEP